MERVPDIKSRLEVADMKKWNDTGWYCEVHFEIGMTFDNEIKFYIIVEGNRSQIEAEFLEPEFRPAIRIKDVGSRILFPYVR
jgi:hypothetical protein